MAQRLYLAMFLLMPLHPVWGQTTEIAPYEVIPLWNGTAPGSEDYTAEERSEERGDPSLPNRWVTEISRPTLTLILPEQRQSATAGIVICPGGGYGGLAFDKEGIEIGEWFRDRGMAAFVLKYRCGGGPHQHPVPLSDVQRAMQYVRHHADRWNIDPKRIGVMGFSAGGHLASTIATHFETDQTLDDTSLERTSSRADFAVLIYPVISMREQITHGGSRQNLLGQSPSDDQVELLSNDEQVTQDTPPTFLVHATDDRAVPVANSLRYYEALVKNEVPAELHVFEQGGHGFGMRSDLPVNQWPELLQIWLENHELMEATN